MPIATMLANFGSKLPVTSLKALIRSILLSMGLDHVLIDFLLRTAAGAAGVLAVIAFVGIRIPKRSMIASRRISR
jgi:hypothetical protein